MTEKFSREDFMKYVQIEPRLLELESRIIEFRNKNHGRISYDKIWSPNGFNAHWYGDFKRELSSLVGWEVESKDLNTVEAYNVCYSYLYDLSYTDEEREVLLKGEEEERK